MKLLAATESKHACASKAVVLPEADLVADAAADEADFSGDGFPQLAGLSVGHLGIRDQPP